MISKAASNALVFLGLFFFAVGLLLMFWAERFSVVWRTSMFMNAPMPIVIASIIEAIVSVLLLSIAFFNPSHKTSRASTLLLIPALLLCFTQLGIILNGSLDTTTPNTFWPHVMRKHMSKSSKGETQWYIHLQDWQDPLLTVQLAVPETEYRSISPGTLVEVRTKKGYFGFEWLVSYRIDPPVSIRSEKHEYSTSNGGLG